MFDQIAVLEALQTLLTELVDRRHARSRKKVQSIVRLLKRIADCLEEMESELRRGVVPTGPGNELKKYIEVARNVTSQMNLPQATKINLVACFANLKAALCQGEAEDEYLRGHIRGRPEDIRQKAFAAMLRTAAKARAMAEDLRASAA